MRHRYPAQPPRRPPTAWLMTDERMGTRLWRALLAIPPGSGVVFRHHATPAGERARLYARVRRIARARGLVLIVAGDALPGADGVHGAAPTRGWRTWPAHDAAEARAGVRHRADLLFVSPLFATRTHPGAAALGPRAAGRIGRGMGTLRIAMGGMDERRWRRLRGFHGWAAIDAWLPRGQAD